jgi:hypothetical protein
LQAEAPIENADVRHGQLEASIGKLNKELARLTTAIAEVLRKVLDGRVAFISRADASNRWYEMAGKATLEKFFASIPTIQALVAVRGIDTVRNPLLSITLPFSDALRIPA